jgi:hypothetical protein
VGCRGGRYVCGSESMHGVLFVAGSTRFTGKNSTEPVGGRPSGVRNESGPTGFGRAAGVRRAPPQHALRS